MKRGDRVTVNVWGVQRFGTVADDQRSGVVFVILDGDTRRSWFHAGSLTRLVPA